MANPLARFPLRSGTLALALLLLPSASAAQANGQLQIHFINVGQGDATLIVSPLGETMLIDSGPESASACAGPTGIITYLDSIGLSRLDYHVASHYHPDHIGCTEHVVARWPIQRAAFDRGTASVPATTAYAEYAGSVASMRQTVSPGQQIVLDEGSSAPVVFQVVAVNANGVAVSNESDRSVILVLRSGPFDAEFGGDIGGSNLGGYRDLESLLVSNVGQVELHKVHHHGSQFSSNIGFLATVRPKVAVLSVGSPNAFDHPNQAALDNLRSVGAVTYWTTAGDGAPAAGGWDVVANGAVVVHVSPGSGDFTVSAAGSTTHYPSWDGPVCSYGVHVPLATVPASGTSGTVSVFTIPGCHWTAASDAPWLAITSPPAGIGSGSIALAVAPNPTLSARTATIVVAGQSFTVTQRRRLSTPGDFNGDGRADVTVFRPDDGTWYVNFSSSAAGYQWGNASDIAAPGDYDGDGTDDLAVFRPSEGTWYIRHLGTGGAAGVQWGNGADRPVPADYDGDGRTDIAVFRPSDGVWYIVNSSTGSAVGIQWGNDLDVPVPGDYDGDGRADVAVFRPSNGTWYIRWAAGGATGVEWGNAEDMTVPGDYDGDGLTDVAVFRPSLGNWYVRYSGTGGAAGFQWGNGADIPVPGDYNGDMSTDVAVFRPSDGVWYVLFSGNGTAMGIQWGNANDSPINRRIVGSP
jgi:beta-lactamase superfamily II metal-dependent hydrolase